MRNRFPGICYRCGGPVAAGDGHFEKVPGSRPTRWRTQHADCAIQHRGTKVGKTEPQQPRPQKDTPDGR